MANWLRVCVAPNVVLIAPRECVRVNAKSIDFVVCVCMWVTGLKSVWVGGMWVVQSHAAIFGYMSCPLIDSQFISLDCVCVFMDNRTECVDQPEIERVQYYYWLCDRQSAWICVMCVGRWNLGGVIDTTMFGYAMKTAFFFWVARCVMLCVLGPIRVRICVLELIRVCQNPSVL